MIEIYKYKKIISFGLLALILLAGLFYFALISPPRNFPEGAVVRIEKGETLKDVTENLKEKKIIRSKQWFSNFVHILDDETGVIAGDYYFPDSESSFSIADRVVSGNFGFEPIKVTIPEGLNVEEVAEIFDAELPAVEKRDFLDLASRKEGYLFPDTYFFVPTADERTVIGRMILQFNLQIETIGEEINKSSHDLEDIIIMASILEEEAKTFEDKKTVAGLLWKRIEIGMPLQVDATFMPINGKASSELTREDLQIDSPYNTYKYRGLPPAPISSPGLESIVAAIEPIETEYLYYLSEKDGTIHYAETLEEHNLNKRRFLSNN